MTLRVIVRGTTEPHKLTQRGATPRPVTNLAPRSSFGYQRSSLAGHVSPGQRDRKPRRAGLGVYSLFSPSNFLASEHLACRSRDLGTAPNVLVIRGRGNVGLSMGSGFRIRPELFRWYDLLGKRQGDGCGAQGGRPR